MTPEELTKFQKQQQQEIEFLNKYSPLFAPIRDFQNNLCKNAYETNDEEKHASIAMSRQDIDKLILDFANTMLLDGDLKNEFVAICTNNHPYVKTIDAPTNEQGGVTGRITASRALKYPSLVDTVDIGKTGVVSFLGQPNADGKTITTTLEQISERIHETCHALSQKHCGPKPVNPKSHKVGEIESIFGEALFFEYIKQNAATLASKYNITSKEVVVDENFFLQETAKHDKNLDVRLAKDLSKVFSGVHDFHDPKEYRMRYIVGSLFLPHLMDSYGMNADFTMTQFKRFLKNNSHMNMNEATAALTDGAFTSIEDMIDIYKREKIAKYGKDIAEVQEEEELYSI